MTGVAAAQKSRDARTSHPPDRRAAAPAASNSGSLWRHISRKAHPEPSATHTVCGSATHGWGPPPAASANLRLPSEPLKNPPWAAGSLSNRSSSRARRGHCPSVQAAVRAMFPRLPLQTTACQCPQDTSEMEVARGKIEGEINHCTTHGYSSQRRRSRSHPGWRGRGVT